MADANNWLVKITKPDATTLNYSLASTVYSSQRYEPRLLEAPTIRRSIATPSGGVQAIDDISVALDGSDGADDIQQLVRNDGTATDPRGRALAIYSHPYGDTSIVTSRFVGRITAVSADVKDDGSMMVTLSASADSEASATSLIPGIVLRDSTFKGDSTLAVTDATLVTEALGSTIPVVFGATHEHLYCPEVKRDPTNNEYVYVVCHDAGDVYCRVGVTAVYREGENNTLKVIPTDEYTVTSYTDEGNVNKYVTLAFARAQTSHVYADVEATSLTGDIASHTWDFVDRVTDTNGDALFLATGNMIAEYKFDSNFNDTSGAGLNLTEEVDSEDATYVDEAAGDKAWQQAFNGPVTMFKLTSGTDLAFDDDDDFIIECRLRSSGLYDDEPYCPTNGVIASKQVAGGWATGKGWTFSVSAGYAQFSLQGTPLGLGHMDFVSVTSRTFLGDENWHFIRVIVDRTDGLESMSIECDGVVEDYNDMKVDGRLMEDYVDTGQYTAFGGYLNAANGWINGASPWSGELGYLAFKGSTVAASYEYSKGEFSNKSSAVAIGADELLTTADDSTFDVPADHDLVVLCTFKTTYNAALQYIARKYTSTTGPGWYLAITSSGTLAFWVDSALPDASVTSAAGYADGKWHTAVGILDRDDDTLNFYVDGGRVGVATDASSVGALTTNAALEMPFEGSIDELSFRSGVGAAMTLAQVERQYYNAKGNPVEIIRRVLENSVWGLGETVDDASFDLARLRCKAEYNHPAIYLGGTFHEQREARELLSELCRMFGIVLKHDGTNWVLTYAWESANSTDVGISDGRLDNALTLTDLARRPLSEAVKAVVVAYRRTNDPGRGGYHYLIRSAARLVDSFVGAEEKVIELPYVRDPATADFIAYWLAAWLIKDRTTTIHGGRALLDVDPGERVELYNSALSMGGAIGNDRFRAKTVTIKGDEATVELFQEDPNAITAYSAGTLPPDSDLSEETDYRYTSPPPPRAVTKVSETPTDIGTSVQFSWVMPTGTMAEAVVAGVRFLWRYTESDDVFAWSTIDLDASLPGQIQYLTIDDMMPGQEVEITVHTVSFWGLMSGAGLSAI